MRRIKLTVTEKLAEMAVGIDFEDIPDKAVDVAKKVYLDIIGCALAGYTLMEAKQIIAAIKTYDRSPVSTIWGDGSKVSAPYAAYANCASGENTDNTGMYPPAPTAIALGEEVGADGKKLITALIAAKEVGARIGRGFGYETAMRRGFYGTGLLAPFLHAVAAGKMLTLTTEQMASAIGLAGVQCQGLWEPFDEGIRTKLMFHG